VLQIDMLPVNRLVRYIRNARTHSDDEVIFAGRGRLMAARALERSSVSRRMSFPMRSQNALQFALPVGARQKNPIVTSPFSFCQTGSESH
jgi:hypothetical protein